jgi:hypothetical protein
MNDPPPRVRGFEAKHQAAFGIAIEGSAAPDQLFNRGRRGGKDRKRGRFIAQSIARFERIGKMKFDTIIRAKARGDAALGK